MLKFYNVCISGMMGVKDEVLAQYKKEVEARCPGARVDILTKGVLSEEEAIEKMQGYDVIMSGYQQMSKRIYDETDLKAFVVCSIGYNFVDLEEATKHDVLVANNPAYCVEEVAEHICALTLSAARHIPTRDREIKRGAWGATIATPQFRVSGSTLGFYGFGRIPKMAAAKMAGMGVRIIAHDPYLSPEVAEKYGASLVSFDELAEQSDFLVIQVPLMPSTYGVFNKDVFKKMKKTAFLINTARGPLVKQDELYDALVSGEIAGAALDVLEHEPPTEADRKIIDLPNVIVTGHSGFYSEQAMENQTRLTIEKIIKVLNGQVPDNVVNPEVLERTDWIL